MTPRPRHCEDIQSARNLGGKWEQNLCELAARYSRSFTCHQYKKSEAANCWKRIDGQYHPYLLPDVTLWTAPGEHHEVKHKDPMYGGYYGIEQYRWEPLLWFARETKQSVHYTIHDWEMAGGRDVEANRIEDWVTANVLDLDQFKKPGSWPSWRNGRTSDNEPGWKFHKGLFVPLETFWNTRRGYSADADDFPEDLEDFD